MSNSYPCPKLIPEVLIDNGINPDEGTKHLINKDSEYLRVIGEVGKAAIAIEKDLAQNPYHKYLQEHLRCGLPNRYAYVYAVDKDMKSQKRKELSAMNDSGVEF